MIRMLERQDRACPVLPFEYRAQKCTVLQVTVRPTCAVHGPQKPVVLQLWHEPSRPQLTHWPPSLAVRADLVRLQLLTSGKDVVK